MLDADSFSFERVYQREQTLQRLDERRRLRDLRTDVAVDADHFEPF